MSDPARPLQSHTLEEQKKKLGIAAAALVENQQVVGLGSGSTAAYAVVELGRLIKEENLQINCVSTSHDTTLVAHQAGIHCMPLSAIHEIDISIDGADEIDPQFCLLKGGGGAHAQEKLVHAMSKRFVVIAAASKRVTSLGEKFPVPVEILPAAMAYVSVILKKELGAKSVHLRSSPGKCGALVTDNGNWILDASFNIEAPLSLEEKINKISGVVENGIFAKLRPKAEDCLIL